MPRRSRFQIGVIGLGVIGSRVAAALRQEGHQVYVWNRSPRREPCFLGSPSAVAASAKVLQIFVPDDDSILGLIDLLGDSLTSEHTFICHATISPETTRKAAELVEKRGAKFLDAPFTGSREAAENRQLTYYIGGDPHHLTRVRPILEVTSKNILHLGKIGEASLIKIATNIVSATQVQAVIEALALVAASQIPPSKFAEAMKVNGGTSPLTGMKLPAIISQDFDAHFTLKHMFKDMQHAIRSGERVGLQLPVTDVTRSLLFEGLKEGWGDLDFSALARHYFEVADPVLEEKSPEPDEKQEEPDNQTTSPEPGEKVASKLPAEPSLEKAPEAEDPKKSGSPESSEQAEKLESEESGEKELQPETAPTPKTEPASQRKSRKSKERKQRRHWGRKTKQPAETPKPVDPQESTSPAGENKPVSPEISEPASSKTEPESSTAKTASTTSDKRSEEAETSKSGSTGSEADSSPPSEADAASETEKESGPDAETAPREKKKPGGFRGIFGKK